MPGRLILNADDFGLTRGINRSIAELWQAGVIRSATLMATGPAFSDAVRVAAESPGLGVGCHVVFVDGIPVLHPDEITSLLGADGKTFRPSLADFIQALLRGTIQPEHLAREAQAQIQHLQRAGIDVTHVDTHKHTHLFPAVALPLLHAAERCGVQAFRYPFEPLWSRDLAARRTSLVRRLQQSALQLFEPRFRRSLDPNRDERTTSGTLGIAATGMLDAETLSGLLQHVSRGEESDLFELCCHPGFDDADLARTSTRLRTSRELEHRTLLEVVPRFARTGSGPSLIHYGNLGVPGLQRDLGQFLPFNGHEKVL